MPPNKPTAKQKLAVKKINKLIAEDKPVYLGKIMREVGYTEAVSRTPSVLTNSLGFKRLMASSGLTEELIASSLAEDIRLKPQNRASELKLGAEILKMKDNDVNVNVGFSLSALFSQANPEIIEVENENATNPDKL